MNDVITVGLDGTPESVTAVLWAAQEARLRGDRLRLVHAWALLAPETSTPAPGAKDQNYWPHRIMEEASAAVRAHHPDLPLEEVLVPLDPLEALKDAAGTSGLLVLGSRDLGPLEKYVLGEVGLQLIAHIGTPTVLVRARQDSASVRGDGDVVLGLSLHEPCEALLAFAFGTAARRGVPLCAVHGRRLPSHAYNRGGGVDPIIAKDVVDDAQRGLSEALRPWREKFPDVRVVDRVELESPARALLRDAADAGLLVVGRRHKRRLLTPRIGHVVQAVVHHAACPVAVVPHE
ncbi:MULTISPECIES: universal stress protein [unclassified Streptomyces]|uniref:universal stress protein n=1 Tax=unclassified Streptomyces TaxID=2593676 RepID=UPI00382AA603